MRRLFGNHKNAYKVAVEDAEIYYDCLLNCQEILISPLISKVPILLMFFKSILSFLFSFLFTALQNLD